MEKTSYNFCKIAIIFSLIAILISFILFILLSFSSIIFSIMDTAQSSADRIGILTPVWIAIYMWAFLSLVKGLKLLDNYDINELIKKMLVVFLLCIFSFFGYILTFAKIDPFSIAAVAASVCAYAFAKNMIKENNLDEN